MMNEVRQAWSSLLASRTPTTSAGSAASGAGLNSKATWYDAPAPVIVHNRNFSDEAMNSKIHFYEDTRDDAESNRRSDEIGPKAAPKGRAGRMSATESVASLRRAFLDDFRRSNERRIEETTVKADGAADESVAESARMADGTSSPESSIPSNVPVGAFDDEVLYQNNVEAALNSLSKVCAKELDTSVESTSSLRSSSDAEALGAEAEAPVEGVEEMSCDPTSDRGGRGRRARTASEGSRRHSSSVELTAMTSVGTGDDGMPTISFSFLRAEANLPRSCVRDTPFDEENRPRSPSSESTERTAVEQLYDFPKSVRAKLVEEVAREVGGEGIKNNEATYAREEDEDARVLPGVRLLGDGSVGAVPASSSEERLYDFPKSRAVSTKIFVVEDLVNSTIGDERDESPVRPADSMTSTLSEATARSTPMNCRDGEQESRAVPLELTRRDRREVTYRSLRIGRGVVTADKPEVEAGPLKAYYSDPEFPEADKAANRPKSRRHHRRLGKAWGRMRSWLREEKSRLGEVVNRHAKMQAVGALKVPRTDDCSSLGARCGSYDLVEARTRELGSITRVEEFGLSSVSEEGNVSEPERAEPTSYDLRMISVEIVESVGNAAEDGGAADGRMSKLDSSDEPPDGDIGSGRLRKRTLSTENVLGGTRIKLTPVSFSLDKLFDEEGNDEYTARRDNAEQTREHAGKGGLIKRRMLGSIRGLMASTHLLQQHEPDEGGPGGFEDVRRYVKQGGDFCKELAAVLHERAELEASYSKGLSKLSSKLTKACTKDQGGIGSGGVTEAWRSIGEEMEAAAEAHRAWGIALSEQLAKPLRVGVAEAQGRSRKVIESSVDKASKSLQEWRGIAAKSKKQSFSCARENERLQDLARIQSISQSQQNNNKTSSHHMTEKEVNKLETRRRKAEDSSRRADTEFYTVSVRAERARLEYESTVRKGAKQMELLEEERLSALKDLANVYLAHLQALAPRLQQSADRLSSPVRNCSVSQDVDILKNVIRRLDSNDASNVDQLLPDFYAEHVTLAMNRERRKQSLVRVLHLIRQDLERERRGREGLETLHRAFIQTPAFAADESTQNVTEKLHHMRSMLTFLEAARYKVGGTLAEVEGGKRGKHPLAEHILVSRDKQGLQQSVLKVPSWAKNESFEFPESQDELDLHLTKDHESERRDWVDRTAGDGNSENPPDEEDFSDFDEFSSQSEDNNNQEVEIADITEKGDSIEQCRAIYQYAANLNDELSLTPGDLITIQEKQADGWWIGECGGRTGIFPATYVQIIH